MKEENIMHIVQIILALTSPAWILALVFFGVHLIADYEQRVLNAS
jgi:hypothetical protein